ncbi:hypothetical protein DXT63_05650 [Thermoanaerobacteraceae bacterium SP2]|nr:hypothetical protein DXT63_05650 [Thermoanaerobacteraceae bacterium SP2]
MPNNIIGHNYPKVDGTPKITGQALYTGDLKLPGQLYVKILRSPYAHANIKRIDKSEAEKMAGVICVVSHEDVGDYMHGSGTNIPSHIHDSRIFDSKVRFVGDGVAAVVAIDEETALRALSKINVEYEPLPAVFDPVEATAEGAPRIHENAANNICKEYLVEDGSVQKGLEESDIVLEETYHTSTPQHTPIETFACLAYPDSNDRVAIISPCQSPFGMRLQVARALGIPVCKVVAKHTGHIGGAFGGRQEPYQKETLCAFLALKTGRPVSLRFTREEEFSCAVVRHATTIKMKMGAKKDGTLTFMDVQIFADTGAYASDGPAIAAAMTNDIRALYRIPNQRVNTKCIYTNKPIAGAFRGYGNPQVNFALESMLDKLSEKLDIDPLDIRRKNLVRVGDPNKLGGGIPLSSCGIQECINIGAEKVNWDSRKKKRNPSSVVKKGLGMACAVHLSGTGGSKRKPENTAVFIKANEDGSINVITGFTDMGQGTTTSFAQIAAETIGLPYDAVKITTAVDTDISPFDRGTYASRGTFVIGNAVKVASEKIKASFLEHAGKILGKNPKELSIINGKIYLDKEKEALMTLAELVQYYENSMDDTKVFLEAVNYMPECNSPSFAAQFAEVEVDTETGKVNLNRLVAVHDVGRAINPMLLEGQLEGAIVQGIGYGLTERLVFSPDGRVLNSNFADYKVLRSVDIPKIEVYKVETNDIHGPYGAKSIAESGLVCTAAAIRNAVVDAIGVEINEIPITPEVILKALGKL